MTVELVFGMTRPSLPSQYGYDLYGAVCRVVPRLHEAFWQGIPTPVGVIGWLLGIFAVLPNRERVLKAFRLHGFLRYRTRSSAFFGEGKKKATRRVIRSIEMESPDVAAVRHKVPSLQDRSNSIARATFAHHRAEFADTDDLRGALLERIWETELQPLEEWAVDRLLKRASHTLAKRAARGRLRCRTVTEADSAVLSAPGPDPHSVVEHDDLLKTAVRTDFDNECLRVETGQHPVYRSFTAFAKAQHYCSLSEAYKRRRELHDRIQGLAFAG